MSQVELAERAGLDKKTISQIIKGIEPVFPPSTFEFRSNPT